MIYTVLYLAAATYGGIYAVHCAKKKRAAATLGAVLLCALAAGMAVLYAALNP